MDKSKQTNQKNKTNCEPLGLKYNISSYAWFMVWYLCLCQQLIVREGFGNSNYSEAMETHLSQKANNGEIAGNHIKRKV